MSKYSTGRISGAFAIAALSVTGLAPMAMAAEIPTPTPSTTVTSTPTVFGELPTVNTLDGDKTLNTEWDATLTRDANNDGVLDEPETLSKLINKNLSDADSLKQAAQQLEWKAPETVTNTTCDDSTVKLSYYQVKAADGYALNPDKVNLCLTKDGWLEEKSEDETTVTNHEYNSATNVITFKASPLATPSVTPSETPTASTTETPTASPTATPTASETVSPTVNPTVTASPSNIVPTETPSTSVQENIEPSLNNYVKSLLSDVKKATVKEGVKPVEAAKPVDAKNSAVELKSAVSDSKVASAPEQAKVTVKLPAMIAAPVAAAPKANSMLSVTSNKIANVAPAAVPAAKGTYYLSGRFYNDLDKSGTWNENIDKPIENKELSLYFAGDLVTKVKTNSDGIYKFTGLENGAYDLKWAADGSVGVIQQGPYFTANKENPPLITTYSIDIDDTNDEDYDFGLVMTKGTPNPAQTTTKAPVGDYTDPAPTTTASETPEPSPTSSTPAATKVDSGDNANTTNNTIIFGGALMMLLTAAGAVLALKRKTN